LIDFTREAIDRDGYNSNYHNSFALMGNRHQAKVILANKFSLSPEDEGELIAILGDHFADLINRKFTVKLKDEVFQNETLQSELMGLVGERFGEFFESQLSLSVREEFDRDIYKVVRPDELAVLRTWAKQFKPSIR
jgi:hypothetical protein